MLAKSGGCFWSSPGYHQRMVEGSASCVLWRSEDCKGEMDPLIRAPDKGGFEYKGTTVGNARLIAVFDRMQVGQKMVRREMGEGQMWSLGRAAGVLALCISFSIWRREVGMRN